jgi:hypothetical protein
LVKCSYIYFNTVYMGKHYDHGKMYLKILTDLQVSSPPPQIWMLFTKYHMSVCTIYVKLASRVQMFFLQFPQPQTKWHVKQTKANQKIIQHYTAFHIKFTLWIKMHFPNTSPSLKPTTKEAFGIHMNLLKLLFYSSAKGQYTWNNYL